MAPASTSAHALAADTQIPPTTASASRSVSPSVPKAVTNVGEHARTTTQIPNGCTSTCATAQKRYGDARAPTAGQTSNGDARACATGQTPNGATPATATGQTPNSDTRARAGAQTPNGATPATANCQTPNGDTRARAGAQTPNGDTLAPATPRPVTSEGTHPTPDARATAQPTCVTTSQARAHDAPAHRGPAPHPRCDTPPPLEDMDFDISPDSPPLRRPEDLSSKEGATGCTGAEPAAGPRGANPSGPAIPPSPLSPAAAHAPHAASPPASSSAHATQRQANKRKAPTDPRSPKRPRLRSPDVPNGVHTPPGTGAAPSEAPAQPAPLVRSPPAPNSAQGSDIQALQTRLRLLEQAKARLRRPLPPRPPEAREEAGATPGAGGQTETGAAAAGRLPAPTPPILGALHALAFPAQPLPPPAALGPCGAASTDAPSRPPSADAARASAKKRPCPAPATPSPKRRRVRGAGPDPPSAGRALPGSRASRPAAASSEGPLGAGSRAQMSDVQRLQSRLRLLEQAKARLASATSAASSSPAVAVPPSAAQSSHDAPGARAPPVGREAHALRAPASLVTRDDKSVTPQPLSTSAPPAPVQASQPRQPTGSVAPAPPCPTALRSAQHTASRSSSPAALQTAGASKTSRCASQAQRTPARRGPERAALPSVRNLKLRARILLLKRQLRHKQQAAAPSAPVQPVTAATAARTTGGTADPSAPASPATPGVPPASSCTTAPPLSACGARASPCPPGSNRTSAAPRTAPSALAVQAPGSAAPPPSPAATPQHPDATPATRVRTATPRAPAMGPGTHTAAPGACIPPPASCAAQPSSRATAPPTSAQPSCMAPVAAATADTVGTARARLAALQRQLHRIAPTEVSKAPAPAVALQAEQAPRAAPNGVKSPGGQGPRRAKLRGPGLRGRYDPRSGVFRNLKAKAASQGHQVCV